MKTKKKTKKRPKMKKSKKRTSKNKIKDPPFSKNINQGSDATEGLIQYHYQYYTNITDYIVYLCDKDKQLSNKICLLNDPIEATITFDQTDFKKGIVPKYISQSKLIKFIKECIATPKTYFIPILLETVKEKENHANIILIDIRKKHIELFEPHGNRGDESTLHNIEKTYLKKKRAVKTFFTSFLKDFQFINVVDKLKKYRLQSRYDSNSGYCITWSLLYFHYRILNPRVSYKRIISYIDKKIKLHLLLKYASHVEETLKTI
tara:strand:- start:353 stop:1138 length:786 start_codon:yes stop_codon:yes gene_type:complete